MRKKKAYEGAELRLIFYTDDVVSTSETSSSENGDLEWDWIDERGNGQCLNP